MLNERPSCAGYLYVVLAAVLWASSGTAAKFLFLGTVSPLQLVQLRTTISTAALFLWLVAGKRNLLRIEPKDLTGFFLLGLALAVSQFSYLYAISRINVAAAILLQYQAPVLIALYTLFFTSGRPSSVTILSMLGAVSGCYFMVGGYNMRILSLNSEGIISGLVSALAFAVYTVASRKEDPFLQPLDGRLLCPDLLCAALEHRVTALFRLFSRYYSSFLGMDILYSALRHCPGLRPLQRRDQAGPSDPRQYYCHP